MNLTVVVNRVRLGPIIQWWKGFKGWDEKCSHTLAQNNKIRFLCINIKSSHPVSCNRSKCIYFKEKWFKITISGWLGWKVMFLHAVARFTDSVWACHCCSSDGQPNNKLAFMDWPCSGPWIPGSQHCSHFQWRELNHSRCSSSNPR